VARVKGGHSHSFVLALDLPSLKSSSNLKMWSTTTGLTCDIANDFSFSMECL